MIELKNVSFEYSAGDGLERGSAGGVDEKISNQLESNISAMNNLDNSNSRKRIEALLKSINNRVEDSSKSINTLKSVMIYLGEWMDSTTGTLAELDEKCNIQYFTDNIKECIPDNHSIIGTLEERINLQEKKISELSDIVESKMNQQELRLEKIENQLEKVCNMLEKTSTHYETSNNSKFEKIENSLNLINENIEKLVSYVD